MASASSTTVFAYARYGEQCFNEGNTEEAVTYLTKARELSPDTMDVYVTMIALHMDSGDLASAKTVVEELARVDGGTGVILSAHVSLGAKIGRASCRERVSVRV